MGTDNGSKKLLSHTNNDWETSLQLLSDEMSKFYTCKYKLTLCKGLIMYDSRIFILECLRKLYLAKCPESHQGISKCRHHAQAYIWWPGVGNDIENFVTSCNTCTCHSDIRHQPMVESELPSCPWEVIGSDIFCL